MDLLFDEFYIDEINRLYENYLYKFSIDEISDDDLDFIVDIDDLCEVEFHNEEFNISIKECSIKNNSSSPFTVFKFEDELIDNKLPRPQEYLHGLFAKKVDFNFKGLCNYNVDRSYLNRILKGNIPSKYMRESWVFFEFRFK